MNPKHTFSFTWLKTIWVFGCLVLSSVCHALPSPSQLLESATKGQAELILAISEVERLAPTFSTAEELYPYLSILTELNSLSEKFHFDTIGSNPVRELGFTLTRAALKWIRLDVDPWKVIENFLLWSDSPIKSEVAGQSLPKIFLINDKTTLFTWNERVAQVVELLNKLKLEVFVLEAFSELHANIVHKLLSLSKLLTDQETLGLIKTVKSPASIQAVSAFLKQSILTTKDVQQLRLTLNWVNALGTNTEELLGKVPYFITDLPGSLVVLLLNQAFKLGLVLETEPVRIGISRLQPSQCVELAESFRLSFRDQAIPETQIPFLAEVSRQIKTRFSILGISTSSDELILFWKRVLGLEQALSNQIEGTYSIIWGNNHGFLTLAHVGSGTFFMSVNSLPNGNPEMRINFPFFSVTYTEGSDTWEAQRFAIGDPAYSATSSELYFLKAKFKKENSQTNIDGTLTTHLGQFHVTGRKTESFFTVTPGPTTQAAIRPDGTYNMFSNQKTIELLIYSFASRPQGVLKMNSSGVPILLPLAFGFYDSFQKVVYLSQISTNAQSWTLLKGQLSDDGSKLKGEIIASDRGITHRIELTKTSTPPP